MTIEDARMILKVHIRAAESCGKKEAVFALLESLAAIDAQIAEERAAMPFPGVHA